MTDEQAERLVTAVEQIAASLQMPVPAPAPVEQPIDCPHTEKMRVSFGAPDEFECATVRGGCGYRTPALVASGGS